jgi:hypothetical protein
MSRWRSARSGCPPSTAFAPRCGPLEPSRLPACSPTAWPRRTGRPVGARRSCGPRPTGSRPTRRFVSGWTSAREDVGPVPAIPGTFYEREMRTALDHPLMAMEAEEYFEFGRRLGVHIVHPYCDSDRRPAVSNPAAPALCWRALEGSGSRRRCATVSRARIRTSAEGQRNRVLPTHPADRRTVHLGRIRQKRRPRRFGCRRPFSSFSDADGPF